MQDPIQKPVEPQKPVDDAWLDEPIDVSKIMGTPTPRPATGEAPADDSWLDMPLSAPEAQMDEEPSWWTPEAIGAGLSEGFKAIPRGIANAASAAGNVVNAGARMLPGVDETTFGGMFAPIPTHPLGTSTGVGATLTEGVVQFGAGFGLTGPVVRVAGAAVPALVRSTAPGAALVQGSGSLTLLGSEVAGGAAAVAAFDGHSGRMADLIARIPGMEEPMQRYMGGMLTSDEDSEIEGRLKNALDGMGFGAGIHAVLSLVRFGRAVTRSRAAGKVPEEALAEAHAAVPEAKRALADLYDMRLAHESPFKGQLVDDAIEKAKSGTVWMNRDGSEALGFTIMEPAPKPVLRDMSAEDLAAQLERNLQNESKVASEILKRELKFDDAMVAAYSENVRKMREAGPEQAAARAQVDAVRAKLKQRDRGNLIASNTLGEFATEDIQAAIKYKTAGWGERQQSRFIKLAETKINDPAMNQTVLAGWINKYGTLLDNPSTTIKLSKDGSVEIGVTVTEQIPRAEKIGESIRSAPDMTPAQIGEAAAEITSKQRRIEPPASVSGGGPPESGLPVAIASDAPRLKPNQIFLGELGFDGKTADEIADVLRGEFVEGMAERGQVKLRFEAKGEPFTDAVNPKRMSREELFTRELRRKGMNLEGLKGQPEEVAQTLRTLEKMRVALREAENPLLARESVADMMARVDAELATINGIASSFDKSAYFKLAEKIGVEDANRIGAQAKAGVDFAAGIALDLQAKAADIQARIEKNIPVPAWEKAAWAESRGLAKDALDMSSSLQNALARNQYMQRGEIRPAKGAMSRMTAVQLQRDDAALARIIMENGGEKKLNADIALIAGAGGRDLADLAHVLQLARGTSGLGGMMIEASYFGMLSGLGTPVAQLFGILNTGAHLPLERIWTGAMHLPFARDPVFREAMKDEIAEGFGTYMSMFMHIAEWCRAYKTGFVHGPTLNPRGAAMDVWSRGRSQAITAKNMGLSMDSDEGLLVEAIGDMFSVSLRALQGGDEMIRTALHHSTARARLTRIGMKNGLRGAELGAYVTNEMQNVVYKGQALSLDQLERRAVDQVQREGYTGIHFIERKNRLVAEWQQSEWYKRLSPLSEFAAQLGEEAAFSKPLEPGTLGGDIATLLKRNPIFAHVVAPFHKAGVNIAKYNLQRIDWPAYARWIYEDRLKAKGAPNSPTMNRLLQDMRSGDPVRQARARGRIVLGTTFAAGIYALTMSGKITGRGPSDKNLRRQMEQGGWKPYAFEVNGKYHSFKRLEPIGTIMGLFADFAQSIQEVPDDRLPELTDLAIATATAFAANLTNKSYAKGLADFTGAITSPDEALENWLKGLATRFVPNTVRDVETVVDPTFNQQRTVFDAMIAKMPYLSSELEPRRNVLGEPMKNKKRLGQDTFGRWITPLSIVEVSEDADPVMNELSEIGLAKGDPGSKRGGYDMLDIKSSSGQTSYDRWLENTGKIRLGNKTLRQALEAKIASPAYQRLSADSMNGEPSARASELNTVIQRYRRAALLQTQREIPELNQAVLGERFAEARMRAGSR